MATMYKGGLSDWIRGAQSIIHEWRMMSDSLIKTFSVGLIVVAAMSGFGAWSEMTSQERHAVKVYGHAAFNIGVLSDPTKHVRYTDETGQVWLVRSDKFANSNIAKNAINSMLRGLAYGFLWGLGAMATIVAGLLAFFYFAGRAQAQEAFIRGGRTGALKDLKRTLKRQEGEAGVFALDGLTLPRAFEPQHHLVLGASGTGKSQAIFRALEGVRARGQRAVVYDVNGAYIEKFYDPKRDVILNPLDARCAHWNLWAEVRDRTDYDTLAESFLPITGQEHDTFWLTASRRLFASVAKKLASGDVSFEFKANRPFFSAINIASKDDLVRLVEGTEASSLFDEDAEKMSASIRGTLAAHMKGFDLLRDDPKTDPFSIRDFVTNEDHQGWLFISSRTDRLPAVRRLLTLWVDTAVSTLLSLPENNSRRIWFVFDELPSLAKLSTLDQMLAQARKFGGCAILGLQSFPQLVETYGQRAAESIAGNCSTWLLFRANDPASAKWCSEALGKTEKEEAQEGVSVGRHEMRDGRTLQKQRVERSVVLPAELRNLKDLEYYLFLGRGYPIAKGKLAYRKLKSVAEAFIQGLLPEQTEDADAAKEAQQSESAGDQSAPGETPIVAPIEEVQRPPEVQRGEPTGDEGAFAEADRSVTPPADQNPSENDPAATPEIIVQAGPEAIVPAAGSAAPAQVGQAADRPSDHEGGQRRDKDADESLRRIIANNRRSQSMGAPPPKPKGEAPKKQGVKAEQNPTADQKTGGVKTAEEQHGESAPDAEATSC
ncbi:MAG: type IV secretion system DNA-binding domain-containing protein [Pseudomonadota bacterium]